MASMTAAAEAQALLSAVEINEERFVELLTKLIDNVDTLQNNPSQVTCTCVRLRIVAAFSFVSFRGP